MGQVTHQQADLLLRLYEMRRESRLRQARAWFFENFSSPATPEEFMQKYPPGSEGNTNIRMVTSYWEMVASLVNRGLIDDELFFENTGEIWVVWERLGTIVPAWRAAFKSPLVFANLESLCNRMDAWREKRAPGSTEAMRQMLLTMQRARPDGIGARAASS